jgi:quinol monooxygenase YgiN
MTVTIGLLALLEAKPDKSGELAAFLNAGRELAVAEEETVTWYAFQVDDTHFGIFDTFEADHGRQAHLDGQIPIALAAVADDLLAAPPSIQPVDILAVK